MASAAPLIRYFAARRFQPRRRRQRSRTGLSAQPAAQFIPKLNKWIGRLSCLARPLAGRFMGGVGERWNGLAVYIGDGAGHAAFECFVIAFRKNTRTKDKARSRQIEIDRREGWRYFSLPKAEKLSDAFEHGSPTGACGARISAMTHRRMAVRRTMQIHTASPCLAAANRARQP